jgi:hypothetical protein
MVIAVRAITKTMSLDGKNNNNNNFGRLRCATRDGRLVRSKNVVALQGAVAGRTENRACRLSKTLPNPGSDTVNKLSN